MMLPASPTSAAGGHPLEAPQTPSSPLQNVFASEPDASAAGVQIPTWARRKYAAPRFPLLLHRSMQVRDKHMA